MAAAKITFVSFFVLVLATAATALSIPADDDTTRRPTTAASFPSLTEAGAEAAVADCWKAVVQAESCTVDILRWLASSDRANVHAGAACCGVLVKIGDACLRELFPVLGGFYGPLLGRVCGIPLSAGAHGGHQ